jgi:hypothetical protein
MDIPESMKAELAAWNNGSGIDLESWVGCEGSFGLAVGYASIFWPGFVEFDGFILHEGFSVDALRGFRQCEGTDRANVESVMNHWHLDGIQHAFCPDASPDKLLHLGRVLEQVYAAKLRWQFPDRPCRVSLFVPANASALSEYEITFWQVANEGVPA